MVDDFNDQLKPTTRDLEILSGYDSLQPGHNGQQTFFVQASAQKQKVK